MQIILPVISQQNRAIVHSTGVIKKRGSLDPDYDVYNCRLLG
jgi:hypothetical protein